jgi:hypothetical protein
LRELELEVLEAKSQLPLTSVTVPASQSAIVEAFQALLKEMDHLETFEDKREFLKATICHIYTDGRKVEIVGDVALESEGCSQKNWNRGCGANPERERQGGGDTEGRIQTRHSDRGGDPASRLPKTSRCSFW